MTERLVFLPVTRTRAEQLRSGRATGPWAGFTVTPPLLAILDDSTSTEEAEFAALNQAAVAALTDPRARDGLRLVLAGEVSDQQLTVADEVPGAAVITTLDWTQVHALFSDEPEAADRVAAARAAARGLTVAAALATPQVTELLASCELLWFAPEELDRLP